MTTRDDGDPANRMAWTCQVFKELFLPSPARNAAAHAHRRYIGRGTRMVETRSVQSTSDWGEGLRQRFSEDNARTWGEWEIAHREHPHQGGYVMSEHAQGQIYDPAARRMVQAVFQRIVRGDPREMGLFDGGRKRFWDHTFLQLSQDDGLTWGAPRLLKFEEGGDFDPARWEDPGFLNNNESYVNDIALLRDGRVLVTVTAAIALRDPEDEKIPVAFPSGTREGCVGGVLNFLGSWSEERGDYDWEVSEAITVPRAVSTRGLFETAVGALSDGRVLLVMRGSNAGVDPHRCPGRKWVTVSGDGGRTWSAVTDLRYDTGKRLYSPSSLPALIRSSRTGRLYFVGNSSQQPPEGNSPRYPLVIAEIDEESCTLRESTVTVIDNRDPEADAPTMGVWGRPFENRETLDLELFATRHWTRVGPEEKWTAHTYRYTIRL